MPFANASDARAVFRSEAHLAPQPGDRTSTFGPFMASGLGPNCGNCLASLVEVLHAHDQAFSERGDCEPSTVGISVGERDQHAILEGFDLWFLGEQLWVSSHPVLEYLTGLRSAASARPVRPPEVSTPDTTPVDVLVHERDNPFHVPASQRGPGFTRQIGVRACHSGEYATPAAGLIR